MTELYTTDAEIRQFDLVTLEDDLGFFPLYEAVLVYRLDLEQRATRRSRHSSGSKDGCRRKKMIAMNGRATEKVPPGEIAADFVNRDVRY